VTGPGGRDGYIHIEDAAEVLRMPTLEVSEIAIRLKDFDQLKPAFQEITKQMEAEFRKDDKPPLEIHTWEGLSPFFNIARMLDVMTFFIKLTLVALVLISVLNVMVMAVYERIREIGTMAAIGTPPGKILSLFMLEGLSLGILGALTGGGVGFALLSVLLIKTLYFKDHKEFGEGLSRPSVIETDSPLYKGYKSVMIYAKIKKRSFKDEVFTLTFMPNLESLR